MSIARSCLLATLGILVAGTAAHSTVWLVNPDGSGGAPTIRAALALAGAGDVIELGPGTFQGIGNRDLPVHSAVTIRCRDSAGPPCIIDCEHLSRAFTLYAAATVEGLTIRNGRSVPTGNGSSFFGGGMVVQADAQVSNCVIEDCEADDQTIWGQGAGVYVFGNTSATFTDCTFRDNFFAPFGGGDGAGLCADIGTQVHLVRCTFEGNVSVHGGGLAAYESDVTVEDCVFVGNLGVVGGGIYAGTYGWPESLPGTLTVLGSRITGNARSQVGGARGGGVHVGANVTAVIQSSTIAHNRGWYGGAIEVLGTATVESSILWGNCAIGSGEGRAAYVATGGQIDVACSIVDPSEVLGPGQIVLGAGNVAADPLFCAAEPCAAAPTAAGTYDVDAMSPALALPGCGAVGSVAAVCAAVGAPAPTPDRVAAMLLHVGPSPFTEAVGIRWAAPAPGAVGVSILDVTGRRIRKFDRSATSGSGALTWDGTDDVGRRVASGVYFVRLDSPAGSVTRRVVLRR